MGNDSHFNFAALAAELLKQADTLVPLWLPGGKLEKHTHEYVCASLSGGEGDSCKVNLRTGKWADFATDDAGKDLIGLYACIRGLEMGKAAYELAADLGLEDALGIERKGGGGGGGSRGSQSAGRIDDDAPPWEDAPPAGESAGNAGSSGEKRKSVWEAIAPVPEGTPKPLNFRHWKNGAASAVWEYRFGGQFYGYVCRFDVVHSDGRRGKEIVPLTWCIDTCDERGTHKWHWKQWNEPRPLYVPAGELSDVSAGKAVVLVEGEKCAKNAQDMGELRALYDFVSWPGGSNAFAKAQWSWLSGREVILWPDADCKRFKLTAQERNAQVDPDSKPVMPLHRQPGYKAMAAIGSHLIGEFGCKVRVVRMDDPSQLGYTLPDGWDIADALSGVLRMDGTTGEDAWGVAKVKRYLAEAKPFVPPDEGVRAKAGIVGSNVPHSEAGAGRDKGSDDPSWVWETCLIRSAQGAVKPVRENVVMALDGWPERDIPGIEDAKGLIAKNEFTNDVVKLHDTPWGTKAGSWEEVDELRMGEWLVREHGLPSMPRGTLEEAVMIVADRYKFHPVREYLESLKWDGEKRLHKWLRRCCMEGGDDDTRFDDTDPLQQYLARAGTWFIQAMCARVMEPGCKFDYMLILEGPQGRLKSGLFKVLGGAWFADTGLNLSDKDSLQQLQGRWVYEFAELDAFGRADVTKIKQYTASSCDYFRASYARRAQEYPRQIVFGGTTNENHYLTDPTGNRRFWPVTVSRVVDIEWLKEVRDLLFAEGMERWRAGMRMFPTFEEQNELFEPQQNDRMIDSPIESLIINYLYPENPGYMDEGASLKKVTLVDLLKRIGILVDRLTPTRFHEKRAVAALRRLGWVKKRDSAPPRKWMYYRPDNDNGPTRGTHNGGADDACPV